MRKRGFVEVDVFGAVAYRGNPLAVVLEAEGLSADQMLDFTRWTNFSEATFLLPPTSPEADYKVRIFTQRGELPFAGHPTLGTCHAWLEAGGKPRSPDRIVQECGAGNVPIKRQNGKLAFAAPPLLRSGPVEEAFLANVAEVLGIPRAAILDSQWIDNGPGWVGVMLKDRDAVLAVQADFSRYKGPGHLDVGLVGPHPSGSDCAFEVRALFAGENNAMIEDPVTGSLNASLAQWLLTTGKAKAPYCTSQGTKLGRQGRPEITRDEGGAIWIGGNTFTCVQGSVDL